MSNNEMGGKNYHSTRKVMVITLKEQYLYYFISRSGLLLRGPSFCMVLTHSELFSFPVLIGYAFSLFCFFFCLS